MIEYPDHGCLVLVSNHYGLVFEYVPSGHELAKKLLIIFGLLARSGQQKATGVDGQNVHYMLNRCHVNKDGQICSKLVASYKLSSVHGMTISQTEFIEIISLEFPPLLMSCATAY